MAASSRQGLAPSRRRGRRHSAIALAAALALVAAGLGPGGGEPAVAGVVGGGGDLVILTTLPVGVRECGTTPGANTAANCLGSPRTAPEIYAFNEQQSYTLPANLTVDFGPESSNWTFGTPYTAESQIIGQSYVLFAGDRVASHLAHSDLPWADPVATTSPRAGTLFLHTPQIYGLVFTESRLGATDALGATGVLYPTVDAQRGLELTCPGTSAFTGLACTAFYNANADSFEIGPTGELNLNAVVGTGMDQARVLTNVPDAPTVVCPGPVSVPVGQNAHAEGTFADADSFPVVTLSADRGGVTQVGTGRSGTWSWDLDTSVSIPSSPVVVTATDEHGRTGTCSFNLTVTNVVTVVVPPGGAVTFGGTKVTPATPLVAKVSLPKRIAASVSAASLTASAAAPAAQPGAAQESAADPRGAGGMVQAAKTLPGLSSSVSGAILPSAGDPDCIVAGNNVCFGAQFAVDPGPGAISKKKPAKVDIQWIKDPRKASSLLKVWVIKLRPGTNTKFADRRVPVCQKVNKEYVNTPCVFKESYPKGNFKVRLLMVAGNPKFRLK